MPVSATMLSEPVLGKVSAPVGPDKTLHGFESGRPCYGSPQNSSLDLREAGVDPAVSDRVAPANSAAEKELLSQDRLIGGRRRLLTAVNLLVLSHRTTLRSVV